MKKMRNIRPGGALVLLCIFHCLVSEAQRLKGSARLLIPRDKVHLKNGDSETGKVIFSDSLKILLQKYDYSEKNILWKEIDTITGLSFITPFFSPSFGYGHWKNVITQRLDTFSADVAALNLKAGIMRKKKIATYSDFAYEGGNGMKVLRIGIGIRRYFFSNYVKPNSFYIGLNGGYNFPQTNMNKFFDLGWGFGYEYLLVEKYRLFAELNTFKEQKHTPKPSFFSFMFGVRFSREYLNFYKRLNQNQTVLLRS